MNISFGCNSLKNFRSYTSHLMDKTRFMFKKLCLFLLLPVLGYSQSLDVSVLNSTAGNQYTTFGLGQHNVTFSNNGIRFSASGEQFGEYMTFGVSPSYSSIAALQNQVDGARAFYLNANADTLASYQTISVSYDDPSVAVYPMNSGKLLLRNNIANFTLYNPLGSIIRSGSGSSQSQQGEAISEVAIDPLGKTILLYTPKIKLDGGVGSQANILTGNDRTESIFYSTERVITYGDVSANGQFVVLITAAEGTDDRAVIMDRFGNELNTITSEENLTGAYFANGNEHILLHSSRRALVYSTLEGERLGSTSFRSPLLTARYFSADQTIVGVTGSKVTGSEIYRDLEFHAINLERREIARQELSGALGTSPSIDIQFVRDGAGQYRLRGTNKIIQLRASF